MEFEKCTSQKKENLLRIKSKCWTQKRKIKHKKISFLFLLLCNEKQKYNNKKENIIIHLSTLCDTDPDLGSLRP